MLTLLFLPATSADTLFRTASTEGISSTEITATNFVYSRILESLGVSVGSVATGMILRAGFDPPDIASAATITQSMVHSRTQSTDGISEASAIPNVLLYRAITSEGLSTAAVLNALYHSRQITSEGLSVATILAAPLWSITATSTGISAADVLSLVLRNATTSATGLSTTEIASNLLFHAQPNVFGFGEGSIVAALSNSQILTVSGISEATSVHSLVHQRQPAAEGISAAAVVRVLIQSLIASTSGSSDAELVQDIFENTSGETTGISSVDLNSFIVHSRAMEGFGTSVAEALSLLLTNRSLQSLGASESDVAAYSILRNAVMQIDALSTASTTSNWLFNRIMNMHGVSDAALATPATVLQGVIEAIGESGTTATHQTILKAIIESDGFAALNIISRWIQNRQALTFGNSDIDAAEWIMLGDASTMFTDGASGVDLNTQIMYHAQNLMASSTSSAQVVWIANLLVTMFANAGSEAALEAMRVVAQTMAANGASLLQIAAGVLVTMEAASALATSSTAIASTHSLYSSQPTSEGNAVASAVPSLVRRAVPQTIFAQGELTAVSKALQPAQPATASVGSVGLQPRIVFNRSITMTGTTALTCQPNQIVPGAAMQFSGSSVASVTYKLIQLPLTVGRSEVTLNKRITHYRTLLANGNSQTHIGPISSQGSTNLGFNIGL